jgi:hypothetical protein
LCRQKGLEPTVFAVDTRNQSTDKDGMNFSMCGLSGDEKDRQGNIRKPFLPVNVKKILCRRSHVFPEIDSAEQFVRAALCTGIVSIRDALARKVSFR